MFQTLKRFCTYEGLAPIANCGDDGEYDGLGTSQYVNKCQEERKYERSGREGTERLPD